MHKHKPMTTSYCVETTPIITPSTTSAHIAFTANTNVRAVRATPYIQQSIQQINHPTNINAESSSPLIVVYLDTKIAHEGEIITSSTHTTGNNECKRTPCSFTTAPHPAVAAIHSSNKRPKINEVLSLPLIAVINCIQAAKQCMRARCIVTRLHAYYMEHQ